MKERQLVDPDFRMVMRVIGVVVKESLLHPCNKPDISINPRKKTITVTREPKKQAKQI